MNVNIIKLPQITCHHSHTKSILEIITHTILFSRVVGIPIKADTLESALFDDLVYPIITHTKIEQSIKDQIQSIIQLPSKRVQTIIISLYYCTKSYGILGTYTEKNEYERWKIDLNYTRDYSIEDMRTDIRDIVSTIIDYKEFPIQLPNEEKFAFGITQANTADSPYYDLFGSLPKIFGTP